MNLLEWIAAISGILGVYLTIKQKLSSWPVELVAIIITGYLFFKQDLLGNMWLQVFYFVSSIYGWLVWRFNNRVREMVVIRLTFFSTFFLLLATAVQAGIYYFLLLRFNGHSPLLDSVLTASSVTATFMMAQKYIENWIAWIFIDLLYVVFLAQQKLILLAGLSFVFSCMAVYGYVSWKKIKKI